MLAVAILAAITIGEYIKDDILETFVEGLGTRYIETCHDIHNSKGHTLIRYQHADKAGRVSFKMRRHDIEEFNGVVARHGAWNSKVAKLVDVMVENQPTLFDRPAKKKPAKKKEPAAA